MLNHIKKNKLIKRSRLFIAMAAITIGLISCYSDYVVLYSDYSFDFAWNTDSTAYSFLAVKRLLRSPQGISKFPDGGISKIEYFDAALYYYNNKYHKLKRIADLNKYNVLYKVLDFRYIKIAFNDSVIYYKLKEISDFKREIALRNITSKEDSLKILSIVDESRLAYAYDIRTSTTTQIDSLAFFKQYKIYKENKQKNESKKYHGVSADIINLSLSDWGIILKDVYPQSDEQYINYIKYAKGGPLIREAILEQIFPNISKNDIRKTIEEMSKYKQKLDKKTSEDYDRYYKEMIPKLKRLL